MTTQRDTDRLIATLERRLEETRDIIRAQKAEGLHGLAAAEEAYAARIEQQIAELKAD